LRIEKSYIKQLTTNLDYDGSEVFSPDGKRIVYRSFASGKGNLWVMDTDGNNKKQILPDGSNGCGPNFSPDGKYLAFSNGNDIFVITNIEEVLNKEDIQPNLVQLTTGLDDNDHWPYFSPDGKWLAYGSTKNGNRDIFVITNISDVINLHATPTTKRITTDPAYDNGPCGTVKLKMKNIFKF
jgi:TolB protein